MDSDTNSTRRDTRWANWEYAKAFYDQTTIDKIKVKKIG